LATIIVAAAAAKIADLLFAHAELATQKALVDRPPVRAFRPTAERDFRQYAAIGIASPPKPYKAARFRPQDFASRPPWSCVAAGKSKHNLCLSYQRQFDDNILEPAYRHGEGRKPGMRF